MSPPPVMTGGRFVPVASADADATPPRPSETTTAAVTSPTVVREQVAVLEMPEAHPVHRYVTGSPSGSVAEAVKVRVHGGWQAPPPSIETCGGRLPRKGTVRAALFEAFFVSVTVTVIVSAGRSVAMRV